MIEIGTTEITHRYFPCCLLDYLAHLKVVFVLLRQKQTNYSIQFKLIFAALDGMMRLLHYHLVLFGPDVVI